MIRTAAEKDKNAVNIIRRQVHQLHAAARPDMFKSEFSKELADRYDYFLQAEEYRVVVCDDMSCGIIGFAVMKKVSLGETPYSVERNFLLVEELGVDARCRRRGVGAKLINAAKDYAKKCGFSRLQLDMWAFNDTAEQFYTSQGFETYRKYMEIII